MTPRTFLVFYRQKGGTTFEVGNPFTAENPREAAQAALGLLARAAGYTGLAVLDHYTERIHMFDIEQRSTSVLVPA